MVRPASTVYEDTGKAAALLLDRLTDAPPVGAAPLSVTVTVAVPPDVTVDGLMAIEVRVTAADGDGITVIVAYWLECPYPAATLKVVDAVTAPACAVKLPLVWPAGITKLAGTGNAAGDWL